MITFTDYSRTAVFAGDPSNVLGLVLLKLSYVFDHYNEYKIHSTFRESTQELRVYWNGKICFHIGLIDATEIECGKIFDFITLKPCKHYT